MIFQLTKKTSIFKELKATRDIINDRTFFAIVLISTILLFSSMLIPTFADSVSFVISFDGIGNSVGTAFVNSYDVAVDDGTGNIYVTDWIIGLVQVYDSSGNFQFDFDGTDGGGTAFDAPTGIVMNDDTGNIYVTDNGIDGVVPIK